MILTYKFRVKDKNHLKALRQQQWKVNLVWNFCVTLQRQYHATWFSHFDLSKASQELGKEHGIHSDTRSEVCKQFASSRNLHKKIPKFRSMKKTLGWVPFIRRSVQLKGDCVTFQKRKYRFWRHRDFNETFKNGCFVQNAQGHWNVTFTAEAENLEQAPDKIVGIDLGLKDLAALSDGTKIEAQKHFRALAEKLAIAQRSGNKKRVKAIHAKIKNRRRHQHHVESARIARSYRQIVVGNVSSSKLAKTKMAKSVLDAGWYMFKTQLAYKASRHHGELKEVNEAYSTQTCSSCGTISDNSPKGRAGLEIRTWECIRCNTVHDRDINAALNILSFGLEHQPLVEESPRL